MKPGINLILGTMTFGEQVFGTDVRDMIQYFMSFGYTEIDTAYVYNNGESERLLGAGIEKLNAKSVKIATKVNPRITGRLDKDAVLTQFAESLQRMKVNYADTLYLHFPDPATPMESALEGCARLYDQHKFKRLGLSNFPAWMVSEACHICEVHGWMRPSVYEGLYNALSRNAERELEDVYKRQGFTSHPILGSGIGAASAYSWNIIGNAVHNCFIELLADQGIAGCIIAIWMYIDMMRIQRDCLPFMLLLMSAFFLPLFFLTGYSNLTFWMPMLFMKMVSNMLKRDGIVRIC